MSDDQPTTEADDNRSGEDQSDDAGDADSEPGTEVETERRTTRAAAATLLRRVADGVEGGAVTIDTGTDAIEVAVPETFDLELECERDEEAVELEVEMEWPRRAVGSDADQAAAHGDGHEESGATDDEADDAHEAEHDPDDGDAVDTEAAEPDRSIVETVEPVGDAERQARFELFEDRADEWRWRLVHPNGNVIADSGEGYTRKENARKGLESVMRNAAGAAVVENPE